MYDEIRDNIRVIYNLLIVICVLARCGVTQGVHVYTYKVSKTTALEPLRRDERSTHKNRYGLGS